MMLKCAACGAAWTSLGMTLCPMCGAKVEQPLGVSESGRHERIPAPKPAVAEPPRPILSSALPLPVSGPSDKPPVVEPPKPILGSVLPPPPPKKAAKPAPKVVPAVSAPSDVGFDRITFTEPSVAPSTKRASEGRPVKPLRLEEDDSWYCSLPSVAPPPKQSPPALRQQAPIESVPPSAASTAITELMDASVLADRVPAAPRPAAKRLPAPARPLTVPLVLGVIAPLAGLLLPLTAAMERNRIVGVLGVCVCGLLVPLAPLAWIAGLAAERRRREQGLRAERRVVVGRLLGQWGTFVLAAEGAIALLTVSAMRLVGKLPVP